MSHDHTEGQTLVGFYCDAAFIKEMDAVRGYVSRSQFCRTAIREKLERMGVKVGLEMTYPPDRKGKGGRPRTRSTGPYTLNETEKRPKPASSKS